MTGEPVRNAEFQAPLRPTESESECSYYHDTRGNSIYNSHENTDEKYSFYIFKSHIIPLLRNGFLSQ